MVLSSAQARIATGLLGSFFQRGASQSKAAAAEAQGRVPWTAKEILCLTSTTSPEALIRLVGIVNAGFIAAGLPVTYTEEKLCGANQHARACPR